MKHLEPHADAGHPSAQYVLGYAYIGGYGVPQNETVGKSWLQNAVDQSHKKSRLVIQILENGLRL